MYAKLFSSLYQGTLRGKSHEILVFTNLLAHCDKEGFVDNHFRAIAEETGLTQDEVKAAIVALETPDPESRSPEMDGRRIVPIDGHRSWGWQVVNYGKYRAIKDEETRRETWRKSQQKRRTCQHLSTLVNLSQPQSTHIEGEGDADENPQIKGKRGSISCASIAQADEIYRLYPRKQGKAEALKAIKRALKTNPAASLIEAVTAYAEAVSRWPEEEREFVPYPQKWFDQARYDDDRSTWERKPRQNGFAPTDHRAAKAAREFPHPDRPLPEF